MPDFGKLLNECEKSSEMFSRVVEDFLFGNVVNFNKLKTEINTRFNKYQHVLAEIEEEQVSLFMTQYITHAILKKNGLIQRYLNHSAVKRLKQADRDYLQYLSETPWRFSFSIITGYPYENFFEMEDVFTGDTFLLYSPGVTEILSHRSVSLWFNLIGYNGRCWQSYGPISAYMAFTPDDIFFFATELNHNKSIETDEDVLADVENNPVPYMMLFSGSAFPLTVHKNDPIIQTVAEYDIDAFSTKGLDKDFTIEYANNVYRLSLKRWSGHPHFCSAYYDENKKVLSLFAMTDRGFQTLAERLNNAGFRLYPDPDIRVTMAMSTTAGNILKKEIHLNEYDALFTKDVPAGNSEHINKLNKLMEMAIPDLNDGKKPDIKALAHETGLDEETVKSVLKHVTESIDSMKKRIK